MKDLLLQFWNWLKEKTTIDSKRKNNVKYSRGKIEAKNLKRGEEARREFVKIILESARRREL